MTTAMLPWLAWIAQQAHDRPECVQPHACTAGTCAAAIACTRVSTLQLGRTMTTQTVRRPVWCAASATMPLQLEPYAQPVLPDRTMALATPEVLALRWPEKRDS